MVASPGKAYGVSGHVGGWAPEPFTLPPHHMNHSRCSCSPWCTNSSRCGNIGLTLSHSPYRRTASLTLAARTLLGVRTLPAVVRSVMPSTSARTLSTSTARLGRRHCQWLTSPRTPLSSTCSGLWAEWGGVSKPRHGLRCAFHLDCPFWLHDGAHRRPQKGYLKPHLEAACHPVLLSPANLHPVCTLAEARRRRRPPA